MLLEAMHKLLISWPLQRCTQAGRVLHQHGLQAKALRTVAPHDSQSTGQFETFKLCLGPPKDATDTYRQYITVIQQLPRSLPGGVPPQPDRLTPHAGQTALLSLRITTLACMSMLGLLKRALMSQTKAPPCVHRKASALHACL